MKILHIIAALIICTIYLSCAKGQSRTDGTGEIREVIGVSNWTGHWDEICSPGETLIFQITAKDNTQEFTIPADSDKSYIEDIEEGDLIKIQVFNENGSLILSGSKDYKPSNPDIASPALNGAPFIQVCNIGELEMFGF